MIKYTRLLNLTFVVLALTTLVACNDGPAEEAGENVDHVIEESGESVDRAVDNMGQKMENMGEDMKN